MWSRDVFGSQGERAQNDVKVPAEKEQQQEETWKEKVQGLAYTWIAVHMMKIYLGVLGRCWRGSIENYIC